MLLALIGMKLGMERTLTCSWITLRTFLRTVTASSSRAQPAVAGQQSIVSAFNKQHSTPKPDQSSQSAGKEQKKNTSSLSSECGEQYMLQQRMWRETGKLGQGAEIVKFCHFCGRRCHIRCVQKAKVNVTVSTLMLGDSTYHPYANSISCIFKQCTL